MGDVERCGLVSVGVAGNGHYMLVQEIHLRRPANLITSTRELTVYLEVLCYSLLNSQK